MAYPPSTLETQWSSCGRLHYAILCDGRGVCYNGCKPNPTGPFDLVVLLELVMQEVTRRTTCEEVFITGPRFVTRFLTLDWTCREGTSSVLFNKLSMCPSP